MKCFIRTNDDGTKKVGVEFDNGLTEAVSRKDYTTEDEAKAAIKWLRGYCGPKYAKRNFPKTWTHKGVTRVLWSYNNIGETPFI
jgi:hypothetical protein